MSTTLIDALPFVSIISGLNALLRQSSDSSSPCFVQLANCFVSTTMEIYL